MLKQLKTTLAGLVLLGLFCAAHAADTDPYKTLSPALKPGSAPRAFVNSIQAGMHEQQERHNFVTGQEVTGEMIDALLTQWEFLNTNFSTKNLLPIFSNSEMRHGLFVKDLQMRIMGAVHSLLNPESGGDLHNFYGPKGEHPFTPVQVQSLVDRLTEMNNYMGNRLFAYECFQTQYQKDNVTHSLTRHIELVPAFWSTIAYSLHSYGALNKEQINQLAPVATHMLVAHGEAFQGIVRFAKVPFSLNNKTENQAFREIRQLPSSNRMYKVAADGYKAKVSDIWKIDYVSQKGFYDITTYRNPVMAKEMAPLIAGVAVIYARDFLTHNSDILDLSEIPAEQINFDPNKQSAHAAHESEAVEQLEEMAMRMINFFD